FGQAVFFQFLGDLGVGIRAFGHGAPLDHPAGELCGVTAGCVVELSNRSGILRLYMEFSVQNLCGFLIRSKLMSADGMKAMFQRWQAESPGNLENLGQFTKWLIANKYVTEYQAGLLTKGHAEDFFINDYMILERLGRGRMAGVYKAAHPLGQVVAIKVLPPSKARIPQVLGRFERESRLSLQLKHPNVVRSFQVGKAGEINYLVMEYLEGETLEDVFHHRK